MAAPKVTADGFPHVESVPDIDEQSFDVAAKNYNRMMDDIDRALIGKWYGMPAGKEAHNGYAYYRCGRRGKPNTIFAQNILRQFGWLPAPAGTRAHGYEVDGDEGVYMYARIDVYRNMKKIQAKARQEKERGALRAVANPALAFRDGEDGDALARRGVTASVVSYETGTASFDEMAERARSDAKRGR